MWNMSSVVCSQTPLQIFSETDVDWLDENFPWRHASKVIMAPSVAGTATRSGKKRETRDERSNEMGAFRKRKPAPKSNPRPGTRSQSRYLDASCSSRKSIYSTPLLKFQCELFTSKFRKKSEKTVVLISIHNRNLNQPGKGV
jgi:hypothetical protein